MKYLTIELAIMVLIGCQAPMDRPVCICSDGAITESYGDSCNPLTQTGCNSGEKCNWIFDQVIPGAVGHIGCESNGNVGAGGPCGVRAVGADPCIKGNECVSGQCKQICDVQGGLPECDANHACVRYKEIFVDGTTTIAGVCDPGCDPLTQELKLGTNKQACGSTNPSLPDLGCYGVDEYSCLPVAPSVPAAVAVTLTDRTAPAGDYLNGCAPGFMPILIAETGSMAALCNGLCAATEIDNTKQNASVLELGDLLRSGPVGGERGGLNDGHRGDGADRACRRWTSSSCRASGTPMMGVS